MARLDDHAVIELRTADEESLVSRTVRNVRQFIRSEGLKIGDPLPSEATLGEMMGVSRAVVREALRSMAALGLVDVSNGRRPRVSGMDDSVLALVIDHAVQTNQITVQQILDVRRTIEMRTVGLAAMLRSDREAASITALATAMRRDFSAPDRVMEHDIGFHEAIARASHNPMLALVVGSFHVVTRQTWQIGWSARSTDEARSDSVSCHEAIAAAIAKGDRHGAETYMAEHFDNTVKLLLASGIH